MEHVWFGLKVYGVLSVAATIFLLMVIRGGR